MSCLDCAGDLDHCHGTLIVHRMSVECTGGGCDVAVERHELAIDCVTLRPPCRCVDTGTTVTA